MTQTMKNNVKCILTLVALLLVGVVGVKADDVAIADGYYRIVNGNGNYVNVVGRKTAQVNVDATQAKSLAGTVIRVEAENGIVKTLRSQGVDVPSAATRVMKYVPEIVRLVADKLGLSESGALLGENGVDMILDAFEEEMKMDLHVEGDNSGYRIYVETPSMKPVVDFYEANEAKVNAKLPGFEQAINGAIATIVDKAGMGASLKETFKLEIIWERMHDTTLPEPGSESGSANQVEFLKEVLSNETNVWNFAKATATFYMEKIENEHTDAFNEYIGGSAELKKLWDMAKEIRQDSKYYLIEKDGVIDIVNIIEGESVADDKFIWKLESVGEGHPFTVDFDNTNVLNNKYYTTLYVDFAYTLPEGVKAYKVTEVTEGGSAFKEEITGIIPAQTPVLLEAETSGEKNLTLSLADGVIPTDNELHGNDWLINEYDINSSKVEGLFVLLAVLSQSTADKYEYLTRLNAGTVNNKYFFRLGVRDDLANAYENKTGQEMSSSPVLVLGMSDDGKLGFYKSWEALKGNEAFIFSETVSPVLLKLKGDVYSDGVLDVKDITAMVQIILGEVTQESHPENYDFDAANVDEVGDVTIADLTKILNILIDK